MPIKGYVWGPTDENWGHASLELSDGTYISWWPEEQLKQVTSVFVGGRPDLNATLTSDVTNEGNRCPQMFVLPMVLDEGAIKEWWSQMKKEEKWNLLFNNCCGAVKKALAAGGLDVERMAVETPNGMIDFFEYVVKIGPYAGPRKKKTY